MSFCLLKSQACVQLQADARAHFWLNRSWCCDVTIRHWVCHCDLRKVALQTSTCTQGHMHTRPQDHMHTRPHAHKITCTQDLMHTRSHDTRSHAHKGVMSTRSHAHKITCTKGSQVHAAMHTGNNVLTAVPFIPASDQAVWHSFRIIIAIIIIFIIIICIVTAIGTLLLLL